MSSTETEQLCAHVRSIEAALKQERAGSSTATDLKEELERTLDRISDLDGEKAQHSLCRTNSVDMGCGLSAQRK
jgi:hypothetical protein